jgi:hypothetical protein
LFHVIAECVLFNFRFSLSSYRYALFHYEYLPIMHNFIPHTLKIMHIFLPFSCWTQGKLNNKIHERYFISHSCRECPLFYRGLYFGQKLYLFPPSLPFWKLYLFTDGCRLNILMVGYILLSKARSESDASGWIRIRIWIRPYPLGSTTLLYGRLAKYSMEEM